MYVQNGGARGMRPEVVKKMREMVSYVVEFDGTCRVPVESRIHGNRFCRFYEGSAQ